MFTTLCSCKNAYLKLTISRKQVFGVISTRQIHNEEKQTTTSNIIKGVREETLHNAETSKKSKLQKLNFSPYPSEYRKFLKAGNAAATSVNKKHIQSIIRKGFENRDFLHDPEIQIKTKNTLELLHLASERYGIEHTLVNNLCRLKFYNDKDERRPPSYNRNFPNDIRNMHQTSKDDLRMTIEMLNKDLKLLLM